MRPEQSSYKIDQFSTEQKEEGRESSALTQDILNVLNEKDEILEKIQKNESLDAVTSIPAKQLRSQMVWGENPLRDIVCEKITGARFSSAAEFRQFFSEIKNLYFGNSLDDGCSALQEEDRGIDGHIFYGDEAVIAFLIHKVDKDTALQKLLSADQNVAHELSSSLFSMLGQRYDAKIEQDMDEREIGIGLQQIYSRKTDGATLDTEIHAFLEPYYTKAVTRGEHIDSYNTYREDMKEMARVTTHDDDPEPWDPRTFVETYEDDAASGQLDSSEIMLINRVIEKIACFGTRETIDSLIELTKEHGAEVTRDIATTMSRIDPSYAARQLLSYLGSGESRNRAGSLDIAERKGEENIRDDFNRLLLRLELGKVGVRNGVLEYLDHTFFLQSKQKEGSLNDQLDFARRITTDGKVGLFDNGKQLVGYIQLENLGEDRQRQAQILDISRELVFASPDSPDEIRQQFLEDYSHFFEDVFGEVPGIRMSDLTLREQMWVYQFWKHHDEEIWQRVLSFKDEYGIDGMKTFIAGEMDSGIGDRLLAFAESTQDEKDEHKEEQERMKKIVFHTYGQIIDHLDTVEHDVATFFSENSTAKVEAQQVTREIAKRAYQLLDTVLRSTEKGENLKKILVDLKQMRDEVVVFASIFKTAFKGKEEAVDFSEIQGLDFTAMNISELEEDDKGQMLDISKANWLPRGKAGQGVVDEFEEILSTGKKVDFYVLKKDGKIVSYIRFEPAKDKDGKPMKGRKYAGSFNVDPNYHGSAIGETMIQNSLMREAEHSVLEASVHPDIEVGTMYVEKNGFSITKILPNYQNSGVAFFEIVSDLKKNKKMDSRTMDTEGLLLLAQTQEHKGTEELIDTERVIARSFDTKKQNQEIIEFVDSLTGAGCIGSRYFADPNRKSNRVYVFERDPDQQKVAEKEEMRKTA